MFLDNFNLLYIPQGLTFQFDDDIEKVNVFIKGYSLGSFAYQYATNAEPRFLKGHESDQPRIVFSKNVTRAAAKRIVEQGNFYFDLQGNYEIKVGTKWIRHRVAITPHKATIPATTYFCCTSEQAINVLKVIAQTTSPISAREIKEQSKASLGLAGRIAHCLVENGYLNVSKKGYTSDSEQKIRLLNDWRTEFKRTLDELPHIHCISLFSIEELVNEINEGRTAFAIAGDYVWGHDSHAHNLVLLCPSGDFQSAIHGLPILESQEKGDITIFQCPTVNCWSTKENGVCSDLYGFLTGTKKAEDCLSRLTSAKN